MKPILRFSYALLLLGSVPLVAADDPAGIAFFEQKIRPVLAEHCYECHSTKAKKLKSGLYLDSKAGWQKGGDAGKPVVPRQTGRKPAPAHRAAPGSGHGDAAEEAEAT